MKNGAYKLQLNVGNYIGVGTLTLFANNGQGHDGTFKIEVHLGGSGHDLRGIINVLLVMSEARREQLPQHFSLAVTGSGSDDRFDLIGHGPHGVLVEVTAEWVAGLVPEDAEWITP